MVKLASSSRAVKTPFSQRLSSPTGKVWMIDFGSLSKKLKGYMRDCIIWHPKQKLDT